MCCNPVQNFNRDLANLGENLGEISARFPASFWPPRSRKNLGEISARS